MLRTGNCEAVHVVDKIHKAENRDCDDLSSGDVVRGGLPDVDVGRGRRGARRRHLLDVEFVVRTGN